MMLLRELAAAVGDARIDGDGEVAIERIVEDSRSCAPGDAFVAMRGERVDGHVFVAQAYERGASAAVVERSSNYPPGRAQVVVHDARRAGSRMAARFYGEPSTMLRIVGITGTNGKTTTSYLVRAVLEAAGERCAIVGTLGVDFAGSSAPLANTTPPAIELQGVLAGLRDRGATAVSMEVSSHALALERVDDVAFDVGVLTNVTRDHLDFHRTQGAYVAAKRRLFEAARVAVLNVGDRAGAAFARELRRVGKTVVTYAVDLEADIGPELLGSLALPGRFNVENALAALGVARALRLDLAAAAEAIAGVRGVPGRMERFSAGGIDVVVDYAHTPDALANVLRALRESTRGRLLVVFGCGGARDAGKRPEMGTVAGGLADAVVVTSDNPRSEDPLAIAQAIAAPIAATIVLDRRTAIHQTILEARDGDVVVVAGKGHEAFQIVGDEKRPFDDRDEVRSALRARGVRAP
jgi:UDP-N-acetylmuramoyl-L-alanyl-D-glutamate--2,6-diaminopimelate ligase